MSRLVQGTKITFFFLGSALSIWMIHVYANTWFQIDQFVVHPGDGFSQSQKQAITEFFQTTSELKGASLDQISSSVRGQFQSVGHLALSQDASGVVTAHVESVALQCFINQEFVLSQEGNLFKKNLFCDAATGSLVAFDVPSLDLCCVSPCHVENRECIGTLLPDLLVTACKIPRALLQQYQVSCRNYGSWLLVDKQERRFAILFHGSKIPDEKVIATCNKLKGTLDTRGVFTAAGAPSWIADVRFENQIVLFRNVGGSNG